MKTDAEWGLRCAGRQTLLDTRLWQSNRLSYFFLNLMPIDAKVVPMPSNVPAAAAIKTDARPEPFQAGSVVMLSLCHFIHDVYSSFLSPLLPLLIEKLSLSLTLAGLLSTVMQIPALFNPLIGVWADRISMRWFIILAPAMTAVPMSLIGLAPQLRHTDDSAVYRSASACRCSTCPRR